MTFTVIDAPQRSEAWFTARLGRLTGSNAGDILKAGRSKGAESVARVDLRMRLACERLTGRSQDTGGFVSAEMQRGTDLEPAARLAYEARTGCFIRQTGFLSSDVHPVGCSLDGHVGKDFAGIVEMKCPKTSTHVGYIRGGTVPADYMPQITHNIWVSGAQWCDFVSFDDRLPPNAQLFVVRVPRDEGLIKAYDAEAMKFLAEVAAEVEAIRTLKAVA